MAPGPSDGNRGGMRPDARAWFDSRTSSVAGGIDTPTALAAAREAGAALVQGRLLPSELALVDVRRLLAGLAPAAP